MAIKNEEDAVRKAPLFTALDDASAASLRASMSGVNKGALRTASSSFLMAIGQRIHREST